jgi:hypothetical protein
MKSKKTIEFTFTGKEMSYKEVEEIWDAVKMAGTDCTVSIEQTNYNEPPYGSSTTTYIEVESA